MAADAEDRLRRESTFLVPAQTAVQKLVQGVFLDRHKRPPSASLWPRTQYFLTVPRSATASPATAGGRATHGPSQGVGWEFVHVCIDDASRIAFTMIMPNEKQESAIAFLKAAVAYYHSLGVTVARRHDRQRLLLQSLRLRYAPARGSASSTSAPGPTHPRPTARPSASSRPRCGNGLMPSPTEPQTNAPKSSSLDPRATIGIARMAA